jgi:hypothetical protein
VVLLCCLAGCDQLFGILHVDGVADASSNKSDGDRPLDAAACPTNYDLRAASSTYRYADTGTMWAIAQGACDADLPGRTHLAVLTDEAERIALKNLLRDHMISSNVWIGLSDRRVERDYRWVTAEQVGTPPLQNPPWAAPANTSDADDCVVMFGLQVIALDGLFDEQQCSTTFDFVCECDNYGSNPENY